MTASALVNISCLPLEDPLLFHLFAASCLFSSEAGMLNAYFIMDVQVILKDV